MFSKTFLVSLLAVSFLGAANAANDIAGVQIGSAFATSKALVVKANPGYQINEIRGGGGKVVGINALVQKDGRFIDQFVVIQNDAGIVWFVARAQGFEKGARIKSETLLNSLQEKYGSPSEMSVGSGGPMWDFDREGKLYQGASTQGPCYTGIGAGTTTSFGKVPGALGINIPRTFGPKCGTRISTGVSKDSNDGMVSAFSVQIVDSKRMFDELNNKDMKLQTERQRQLDGEKARDAKPSL